MSTDMKPKQKETKVTEKPILFTGEMVRGILEDRKSQTRRVVNPQPIYEGKECYGDSWAWTKGKDNFSGVTTEQLTGRAGLLHESRSRYGAAGDHLWVKETFQMAHVMNVCHKLDTYPIFKATDPDWENIKGWKWKPSIFMPRKASRITLEIKSIRVERLQDISEADVLAEGVRVPYVETDGAFAQLVRLTGKFRPADYLLCKPLEAKEPDWLRAEYAALWESINGPGSWEKNPWVWVIEFKRSAAEI